MDIVADNISKLKELFPEAFTEGKVDFGALKEVLGDYIDGREERYSFTWNGKSKARMLAQTPSTGTLRPCKEESVEWDTTQNLFIEGDNLEVLKLLQKSYHKKVKIIYIDPPYNTGNDFVYKDNFSNNITNYKKITGQIDSDGNLFASNPETNGRYHTDWINMIYPRLKLARNLMCKNGIIFLSIDDNEIHNARMIMNEVFGEENFIEQIIWKNKYGAGAKTKGFISTHEYILCYSRNPLDNLTAPLSEDEIKKHSRKDAKFKLRGGYRLQPLQTRSLGDRPSLVYPINYEGHEIWPNKQWVWSKDRLLKAIEDDNVEIQKKGEGFSVDSKQYLKDENGEMRKGKPVSVLNGPFTQEGTKEIRELFDGKSVFDFPKPSKLIDILLNIKVEPELEDEIVLDFFAGSCPTAHAVYKFNSVQTKPKRYISVQLPEPCNEKSEAFKLGYKTIAEIGKERTRRAASQITEENPNYHGDLGFKVFKLDSTNIKPWELDFDLTEQDLEDQISNIKHGRKEEDVLYEVLLKYGLDLTLPITEHSVAGHKVFDIGMGALMICLSDNIALDVVEGIAKLKDDLQPEIMRVVFKDAGFADDVVKTNAVQILKQAGIEDVRSL